MTFLLTDQNNRSIGYHPAAEAFANQIPGARYSVGGGQQTVTLPEPAGAYELTFKAAGSGGPYSATVTTVVDGQPIVGSRGGGLAQGFEPQYLLGGNLGPEDGLDRGQVNFVPGRGAVPGALQRTNQLPPGARIGVTERQVGEATQELRASGAMVTICSGGSATDVAPNAVPPGATFPPCSPPTPGVSPTVNAAQATAIFATVNAAPPTQPPPSTRVATANPITPTRAATVTAGPSPTGGVPTLVPPTVSVAPTVAATIAVPPTVAVPPTIAVPPTQAVLPTIAPPPTLAAPPTPPVPPLPTDLVPPPIAPPGGSAARSSRRGGRKQPAD